MKQDYHCLIEMDYNQTVTKWDTNEIVARDLSLEHIGWAEYQWVGH